MRLSHGSARPSVFIIARRTYIAVVQIYNIYMRIRRRVLSSARNGVYLAAVVPAYRTDYFYARDTSVRKIVLSRDGVSDAAVDVPTRTRIVGTRTTGRPSVTHGQRVSVSRAAGPLLRFYTFIIFVPVGSPLGNSIRLWRCGRTAFSVRRFTNDVRDDNATCNTCYRYCPVSVARSPSLAERRGEPGPRTLPRRGEGKKNS